jgi:hypothetical protein
MINLRYYSYIIKMSKDEERAHSGTEKLRRNSDGIINP